MATADDRISNIEGKYSDLHTVVNVLANKVDNLANERRDFKQEMRDRDNQRHAEILALDNKIAALNVSTDAKIDSIGKHIRNLSYTSIAAIAAMVITVLLNLPKG